LSWIARAAAGVAVTCLAAHVVLLGVAGARVAPMLALSLVCAVCARDGWRGRCTRGEQLTMIVLSALMLLTHRWLGHAAHAPAASLLMQLTVLLAAAQLILGGAGLVKAR
jgi:hypothetical protein